MKTIVCESDEEFEDLIRQHKEGKIKIVSVRCDTNVGFEDRRYVVVEEPTR